MPDNGTPTIPYPDETYGGEQQPTIPGATYPQVPSDMPTYQDYGTPYAAPQPYPQPQYPQPQYQQPYGMPVGYPQPQRKGLRGSTIAVIIIALAAVVTLGFLLWKANGTPSIGITSLTGNTGTRGSESPDVWAKIMEPEITDEELALLQKLEGNIEAAENDVDDGFTYVSASSYVSEASQHRKWPDEEEGFGTPETCPQNPQLWVRLAMLSRDWAQERLGGKWEVIDFSYPIGHEDGDGFTVTRVIGTSDDVLGMSIDVECHRWEPTPRFAIADGQEEAAKKEHRRISAATEKLAAYEREMGHEMFVQGGESPIVIVNPLQTDGEEDDDYWTLQQEEGLQEVAEKVSGIIREAGYEDGGAILMLPLDENMWECMSWYMLPVEPLDWKYAMTEDELSLNSMDEKWTKEDTLVYLASGAYAPDEEVLGGFAKASWDAAGNIRTFEADMSGNVRGNNPVPDAEEIFEAAEVSISELPERIGDGSNILYGYLSWPGTPEPNSALWVFYAYDGKDPSIEMVNAADQSAILFKQVGEEVVDIPKRFVPSGTDERTTKLDDGTEVTICSHTDGGDDSTWDEATDWKKAAWWSRKIDDGETYAYMILAYEDIADEEIAKVAEQVR